MKGKGRNRPGTGRLIIGLGFLIFTAGFMMAGSIEPSWQIAATTLAGLVLGFCFLRFPFSRAWVMPLVFVLLFGVLYVLDGEFVIAWVGGYGAGANFGAGWKATKEHSRRATMKSEWTVDERGFDTVAAAREAADAAVRALDGTTHGRLDVGNGTASFQVTGGVQTGLVCHRTADASDERPWAVLVRAGHTLDDAETEWADVLLNGFTGSAPVPLINDLDSVERALDDFFANPEAAPAGPAWVTNEMAEDLRFARPR